MDLIATTLDTVGTLLIAWAALSVHHRVLNEHRITRRVVRTMKLERLLGVIGVMLIFAAYVVRVAFP